MQLTLGSVRKPVAGAAPVQGAAQSETTTDKAAAGKAEPDAAAAQGKKVCMGPHAKGGHTSHHVLHYCIAIACMLLL
jgi:hypothetical protein